MRALVLALLLAACGEPPHPRAPPEVLARMNPNADTSHNPTLKTYGSRWGGWFSGDPKPDSFYNPLNPPHYYMGCGGCSSNEPANALVLLIAVPLLLRRRRA